MTTHSSYVRGREVIYGIRVKRVMVRKSKILGVYFILNFLFFLAFVDCTLSLLTVSSVSSVFPSWCYSSSEEPSNLFVPFSQIPSPSKWSILAALHPLLMDSCSLHGLQFAFYSSSLPHCTSVGHSSSSVSLCCTEQFSTGWYQNIIWEVLKCNNT